MSWMSRGQAMLMVWLCWAAPVWAIQLPDLTTQAAKPEAEAQTMTASVNALMVYGEDKFQMKSQKTLTVLTKNINDPVASLLEMPIETAMRFSPGEEVFRQSLAAAAPLHSDRILRPVLLSRMPAAPFVSAAPGAAPKTAAAWTFRITRAETGREVFARRGGIGDWPAALTWDGLDGGRQPALEPGRKYAWEFAAADAGGKKLAGRRSAFSLAALRFVLGRETRVRLALDRVFAAKSQAELTGAGKDLLNESADFFREGGSDRLEITVWTANEETGAGPAQALQRHLTRLLMLDPERVRTEIRKTEAAAPGWAELRFERNR